MVKKIEKSVQKWAATVIKLRFSSNVDCTKETKIGQILPIPIANKNATKYTNVT